MYLTGTADVLHMYYGCTTRVFLGFANNSFLKKKCFKQFLLHFVIKTIFYDHFKERILRLFYRSVTKKTLLVFHTFGTVSSE